MTIKQQADGPDSDKTALTTFCSTLSSSYMRTPYLAMFRQNDVEPWLRVDSIRTVFFNGRTPEDEICSYLGDLLSENEGDGFRINLNLFVSYNSLYLFEVVKILKEFEVNRS